jgi:8-oxo-dGTP pyrophosphatase MutT (NUDIX family)
MIEQTRCVGVAVFVLRHAPGSLEVLLLKRAGGGFEREWCPVAGKVEPNESPTQAAAREAGEETQLLLTSLEATQISVLHAGTGNPPTGYIQLFVAFTNSSSGGKR